MAKLYGTINFLEEGIYGGLAVVVAAIKERQYERGMKITSPLLLFFEVIEAVLRSRPTRIFSVLPCSPTVLC